jgi:hypothetical protein
MNFAISWVLGLFKKPEVEVSFDKVEISPWAFPAPEEKKRKPQVRKTRPLPSKATVAKAAAKKSIAAKKKTK